MRKDYDGLKVVRIPFSSADIFTSSQNCIQNVQWLEVGGVCVSEHIEGVCQDLEHSKNYEYITPATSAWGASIACQ